MKNYILTIRLCLIFILLTHLPLQANTCTGHINQHVASTPELNRSHVSNLQQDSNGFIWAATWNGLIRYDGHTAHTFKPIQNSEGTIDSDRIYNIKMTADGNIWCVSSDNRLFIFNTHTFSFRNLSLSIPELHDRKVKVLTPLKNGHTWVRLHDGSCLRLTDKNPSDSIIHYNGPNDIINGSTAITGISLDDNGDEWILTDVGALNLTQNKLIPGKYRHVESLHGSTYLIDGNGLVTRVEDGHTRSTLPKGSKVRYVRTDAHRLILATDQGIFSIDTRDGNILRHSSEATTYIYKDSRHRIWGFGPWDGVVMIPDIKAQESTRLLPPTLHATEPIKNPQLIFETPDGELLLRPSVGGLCIYDENSQRLADIHFDGLTSNHYNPTDIKKHLIDSHGNLWVIHNDETDCISFSRRAFTHLPEKHPAETRAIAIDRHGHMWRGLRPGLIIGNGITITANAPAYVIKESPDGKIWVGTKGDGIYVIDPADAHRTIHLSRTAPERLHRVHSDSIYDIAFDGDKIWLGSYGNGLAGGTPVTGGWQFGKIANQPGDMKIRSILPDGKGNLLIATADGLVTTDAGHSSHPTFHINRFRNDVRGLKGNDIMSILKCGDAYYACVFGSGISRIDSDNILADSLDFTTFPLPASAEAGQMRTAIATGHDIWIAAGGTLTRFATHSRSMTSMSCDTPTDRISFSEATPATGPDGNILFGTSDGTIMLSPGNISAPAQRLDMKVTGILYQNDMSVHPLNNPSHILLPPDKRSFSLLLSDMSYTNGIISRMRYRLEGLEEGWNYPLGRQPSISYNNLPPGDYRLIIQLEDHDGAWHETPGSIHVVAKPTFTETIWFRLIILFMLTALFIGLTIAILHYKRLRNALQRKYSLLMTIGHVSDRLDAEAAIRIQPAPTPREDDRLFIETSFKFLNDNIDNPDLMVDDFARHLKMSRTAYYNRMKEVAGVSPVDFIRQTRIKRALKHLESDKYTISEVAYMVGFSDPKYFSRCFKAEMAMTPSQYRESLSDGKLPD